MRRTFFVLLTVGLLFGAGHSFYYFSIKPEWPERYSLWLMGGLPLGLLILAVVTGCVAASDNIYRVKSGKVVDHSFTPAHTTQPVYIPGTPGNGTTPGTPSTYIPGHHEPDDWALCLENAKGRRGWLHFSGNVLKRYPIGSHYPRD